jgi:hypothetical protein
MPLRPSQDISASLFGYLTLSTKDATGAWLKGLTKPGSVVILVVCCDLIRVGHPRSQTRRRVAPLPANDQTSASGTLYHALRVWSSLPLQR